MSRPPALSVVLAVYNGARHLERSLQSVLSQSFADFELIVVDDGSTDATPAILAALTRADPRVIVLRQENRGLTASLNRGIALARGTYVARQDADDISKPERFARQIAYLETHPSVAALGTYAEVIDRSGMAVSRLAGACGAPAVTRGLMTLRRTPVHGSVMMRKNVLEAAGGYREAFRAGQDYDLWLRLISRFDVDNLPDVLYQWRMDHESVYTTQRATQLKYAGVALAMAHERAAYGQDSYELFAGAEGDWGGFASRYRLGGLLHAIWGELLLRGLGNSASVRTHFRQALRRGCVRPWPMFLLGWTHLGLPWPGGKPIALPVGLKPADEP